jgi:hypothetical protein
MKVGGNVSMSAPHDLEKAVTMQHKIRGRLAEPEPSGPKRARRGGDLTIVTASVEFAAAADRGLAVLGV